MPYKNKEDQNRNSQSHYEKHKEYYKAKAREYTARIVEEHKKFVDDLKRVPCLDCGLEYPPWVMQFDHVSGDKIAAISIAIRRGWSKRKLIEEIEKCEIVCANCHAERTHQRLVDNVHSNLA